MDGYFDSQWTITLSSVLPRHMLFLVFQVTNWAVYVAVSIWFLLCLEAFWVLLFLTPNLFSSVAKLPCSLEATASCLKFITLHVVPQFCIIWAWIFKSIFFLLPPKMKEHSSWSSEFHLTFEMLASKIVGKGNHFLSFCL